jgi:hypothetical protein
MQMTLSDLTKWSNEQSKRCLLANRKAGSAHKAALPLRNLFNQPKQVQKGLQRLARPQMHGLNTSKSRYPLDILLQESGFRGQF